MFDTIIVGGSTAGLSAAIYLGRFRRKVLIVDSQKPANRFSHASHSFFTRDGMSPAELVAIGKEQLRPYETVTLQSGEVTQVMPDGQYFTVTLADGSQHTARKILLATGLKDTLPPITGIDQFWGTSVFHCPYCDGWEQRDQPVAIINKGEGALHIAKLLRVLTADLVICSNGASEFTAEQRALLAKHDIRVIETPIESVKGSATQIEQIVFADGSTLARKAIFIAPITTPHSDFTRHLGCEVNQNGVVKIDWQGRTTVTGIYAAGDISFGARQLIFASSQGAFAAIGINMDLIGEDFA
ncbi:MAG: NAD(P)/FAD-dependent oxidoreductase [Anaerolineaceae bacterium]|nr:NAD(P)/FAD-dependent oxidoreductase [Anaerolineaceae bacterium]